MSDSANEIAFEQIGLGNVLKRYQLAVPPNQREYSWGGEHVTQLLQDISKAISDGASAYFLGTIVTIPRNNGASLEVVDGQQRLATTAIFVAAMRDYLKSVKEDLLYEALNEFLVGIDRAKRAYVPRLRLNTDDAEFFGWYLTLDGKQPNVTKPSHERIVKAHDLAVSHIKSIVGQFDVKTQGDVLNKWISFIENRALVVLVRVPNDSNAYKMFETLNDRGLKTSQADLIKNFLFGKASDRLLEVQSRWSGMRGALESLGSNSSDMITFLRYALIVMQGYLRESDVYEITQQKVKSDSDALAIATTFENLAGAYVATFNPEHEMWNTYLEGVRRAISVLNLLDIKPLRPLILAISSKFEKKEVVKAFQYLLALGVRLVIAGGTRSSNEIVLSDTASEVFNSTIKNTQGLKKRLENIAPSNEEFRSAFEIARVGQSRFARYYLRSLEMAAKSEPEPWFEPNNDQGAINLEHVLPKKPQGNWPQFTDEQADLWTNRLGNQVLMRASDNSDVRSAAFAEKKKIYEKSPYVLTNQISSVSDWTVEAIAQRQKILADLALKTWKL